MDAKYQLHGGFLSSLSHRLTYPNFCQTLVKSKGHPSCINLAITSLPEASNSKTKVLVRLGATKTGVVHMASFKAINACFTALFQTKSFFFNRAIKGLQFV